MKSFSDCLKKHGLDKFERELLTSRRDALLEGKEAADGHQAALMAVNAYESELLDRRDAIYKEIGIEPPAREQPQAPEPETTAGPAAEPKAPKPAPEPKAPKEPKEPRAVTVAQAKKHWATVLPDLEDDAKENFKDADWRSLEGVPHVIGKDLSAFHFVRDQGAVIEMEGYISPKAQRRVVGKGAENEDAIRKILDEQDADALAAILYDGTGHTPTPDQLPQMLPDDLVRMLVPEQFVDPVAANLNKAKFKITDRAQLIAPGGKVQEGSVTISAIYKPEKGEFTDTGWMPGQLKGRGPIKPPDPKETEDVQAEEILAQLDKSALLDPQMGSGTFGSFMAREAIFYYVRTATKVIGLQMDPGAGNAPKKAIVQAIKDGRIGEVQDAAQKYLDNLVLLGATVNGTENVDAVIDKMVGAYFDDQHKVNLLGADLEAILDQNLNFILGEIRSLYKENELSSDQTNRKVKVDPKVPPRLENITRKGMPDWRNGRNIETADEFKKAFGFRDVEFGNWVNQIERQANVNLAYDSLMDLAHILGIEPTRIGGMMRTNNALGLAFGGRGKGKASAHYEIDASHHVINLTKNKGNGTVSHEWSHAAEYTLRDETDGKGLTEGLRNALKTRLRIDRIEGDLRAILQSEAVKPTDRNIPPRDAGLNYLLDEDVLQDRISRTTDFFLNARTMDEGAEDPYWAKNVELVARASEAYYFDKISGGSPYLTSPNVRDGVITAANGYKGTAYPAGEERAQYINKVLELYLEQINWEYYTAKRYAIEPTVREGKDGKFHVFDQHWVRIGVYNTRATADARVVRLKASQDTRILDPLSYFQGLANKEAWGFAERIDAIMKELGIAPYPEVKNGSMAESMFFSMRFGWWPEDNAALEEFAKKAYRTDALDLVRKKRMQEDFEAALARYANQKATDLAATGAGPEAIYGFLVELYNKSPRLVHKDSTSMINQAFSTPIPIAWIGGLLTRADSSLVAYDPTAGNGLLAFPFNSKKVILNELEARRLQNLHAMEYPTVHEGDALTIMERGLVRKQEADVVVANPPFGVLPKEVVVDNYYHIRSIDQLIIMRNLAAMKDDGRAFLIMGANRDPGVISGKDRPFLAWLYSNYNVADAFEVGGKLYERMGASWPIRVFVIAGRQLSDNLGPESGTMDRVDSFDALWGRYVQAYSRSEQILVGSVRVPGGAGSGATRPGALPGGNTGQGGAAGPGQQPGGTTTGPGRLPGTGRPPNQPGSAGGSGQGGVFPPQGAGPGTGGRPGTGGAGGPQGGTTGGGGPGGGGLGGIPGGLGGFDVNDIDNILGTNTGGPSAAPKGKKGGVAKPPKAPKPAPPKDFLSDAVGNDTGVEPIGTKPKDVPVTADPPYVAPEADKDEWSDVVVKLVKARPFLEFLRIDPANGRWQIDQTRSLHFSFVTVRPLDLAAPKFVPAGRSTEFLILHGIENHETGEYNPITGVSYQIGALGLTGPIKLAAPDTPQSAIDILDDIFGAKFSLGPDLDSEVYAKAKPGFQTWWDYFVERLGNFIAAMKSLRDAVLSKYKERAQAVMPYLRHFLLEKKAENDAAMAAARKKPIQEPAQENELQVPYDGRSAGNSVGILVPRDHQAPLAKAMAFLEDDVADRAPDGVDQYVRQLLDYETNEAMWYGGKDPARGKGLGGYQVDAIALALLQFERGGGFINGDATGVGKGRQVAALLRWAERHGRIPIFVTVDAKALYSSMVKDLVDIGTPLDEVLEKLAMTDSGVPIKDDDENILREGQSGESSDQLIEHIIKTGTLPGKAKILFTTYHQLWANPNNKPNRRPLALHALTQSGKAVYILDEAHNASGAATELFMPFLTGDNIDTAKFPQAPNWSRPPVGYFSATFAKRPDNLPLYVRTHISLIGHSVDDLTAVFSAGGVPLQQVVSRMLVESGQLIRRERDLSHLRINWDVDKARGAIDRRLFDQVTDILRSVVYTDNAVQQFMGQDRWVRNFIQELIAAGLLPADAVNGRPFASIQQGMQRTPFLNVVHNYVEQLLLATKVDSVVEKSIAAANRGEKVVIALKSTMESMLDDYTTENQIKLGDDLPNFGWQSVAMRGLNNRLRIKYKTAGGAEYIIRVPLHMWPGLVQDEFNRTLQKIEKLKSPLPASPIDMILQRLRQYVVYAHKGREIVALPGEVPEGKVTRPYVANEITGRSTGVDYGVSPPKYVSRPVPNKKSMVNGYANGAIDALIINTAGSTGINLHASADFADQRPRHMIVAQPAADIAIFQQTVGRTNRTWQVEYPIYTMAGSEVPAEARPQSMLRKKLKILTSNTSSSKKTAGEIEDATDFLNQYGSVIVAQYMREHPVARQFVGVPIPDSDDQVPEDLAHKVSGRIAIMSTEDQQDFYDEVTANYKREMEIRNADGTNRLDLLHYPFNAELDFQAELGPGIDPSGRYPLAGPSWVGEYKVDIIGKPPTPDQVRQEIAAALNGRSHRDVVAQIETELKVAYDNAYDAVTRKIDELRRKLADPDAAAKEREAIEAMLRTAEGEQDRFRDEKDNTLSSLREIPIGSAYDLDYGDRQVPGIVVGFSVRKTKGGHPYAPSKFEIHLLRPIPQGRLSLPLTRWRAFAFAGTIANKRPNPNIDDIFADTSLTGGRETRHIVIGNIPIAFRDLAFAGEIMTFNVAGDTTPVDGILMPRAYRPGNLAKQPYAFVTPTQASNYLLAVGQALSSSYYAPAWAAERKGEPVPALPTTNRSDLQVFSSMKNGPVPVIRFYATDSGLMVITLDTGASGKRLAKDKGLIAITGDFRKQGSWYRANVNPDKVAEVVAYLRRRTSFNVKPELRDFAKSFDPGPVRFSWTVAETEAEEKFAARGLPIDQIEGFASALRKSWKNAPPVIVVQQAADLPFPAPKTTRGAYLRGSVYLVADNLPNQNAVQFVLLHETLGHYGLSGVLGASLVPMMRRIYRTNATVRAMADERRAFYKSRGRELAIETAAEEALADLAGSGRWSQVSGWQMLFAAIRSALRKLGFTLGLSNADIAVLLGNARRYVREGAPQATPAAPKLDSGPMFSLDFDGVMGAIKQGVLDRFVFDGKSMSWINKTINTQFHKAETNAYFRPVYVGVQRYMADVNSFANDAADLAGENVLPRMRDLTDVWFNPFKFSNWQKERQLQRDLRAVGQVFWAATLGDMRPTGGELRNGFSATVKDSKGNEIGQVQAPALTDAQVEHYQGIRATIDLSLDQGAASEMVKIARESQIERKLPSIEEARQTAKDDPQNAEQILTGALQERLQTIEDMRTARTLSMTEANKFKSTTELMLSGIAEKAASVRKLQDEGYAPLMRFGQYTVKAMIPETRIDGGIDENVLYFGMFESKKDANRMGREMLAELQQEHPEAILVNGTMDTEAWKQMRGLSLDTLEAFASITGIDKDQAVQEFLKMAIASRSAMKRLIHRKGIKGYDEDIQRVLATFVTSQARLAARNYHFGELTKATQAIPNEMGETRAEADLLTGYVQNPVEEAQGIRGFLFTQFLGGSIASALTNITQPILMTLPYLSQFEPGTGFRGAIAAPAAATRAITKALTVLAKGSEDETLREAMALAAAEGKTEPQEIHQLFAESIRSGLGGRNLQFRKALRLWGSTFALAESFNRKITFIAAFELARTAGAMQEINAKRASQGRPPFNSPYDFAVNAIDETQGVYNKGNRPNWARGGIGATIFTFKQFSIAYVEFLSRLPAREKAIALAILVLAAGAEGLPFEDDLVDLWDTIWQALGYSSNAKKSIRKWAVQTLGEAGGGFLLHGLSGLPGSPIDVSGRLGVGNLIPGTGIFARSTQDATREIAQAVGPIGSVLMSARQAVSAAEEGQFKSAAYNVVPKAIRDAMQAADMWQAGYYRDLKGRRTVETTGVDAAFKFIGLMPYNVSKEAKHRQDIQQDIALHNVVEASIADRWAKGIVDNDPDAVQAAIKDLFAWNLRNPEAPIAINPAQIRQRVQSALMPAETRLMKQMPRELRAREFQR